MLELLEIMALNAIATVSMVHAILRWNLETRYKRHEFKNRIKEAQSQPFVGHIPL